MPEFELSYHVLHRQSDPAVLSLDAYRSAGGYAALEKALREQTPEQVVQQVLDAKLRGRGGAGRLTSEKWRIVRRAADEQKYVICNAYDADSRSLMARSLLESNPHQVIEGILLAAFAVGASEAYLFTRSFFYDGVAAVQEALREVLAANLVGRDILGTDFSCTINVLGVDIGFMGGEETVQMALIKGRRGMPEQRPPYPAQYGLWDKPTSINCIETLVNVPLIVRNEATAFTTIGTATTAGTKILTIYETAESTPKVIEVPFGHLLRKATVEQEVWSIRGERRLVGFYRFGQHKIWGATARILRQLIRLSGGPEPPPNLVPPGETEPTGFPMSPASPTI